MSTPSYLRPTLSSQARRLATVCKGTATKLMPLRFSSSPRPKTVNSLGQDVKAHSSQTTKTRGQEGKEQKRGIAVQDIPTPAKAPAVQDPWGLVEKNVTWADYIQPSTDDSAITAKSSGQHDKGTGEETRMRKMLEKLRKKRRVTVTSHDDILRLEREVKLDGWPGWRPFYFHKNDGAVHLPMFFEKHPTYEWKQFRPSRLRRPLRTIEEVEEVPVIEGIEVDEMDEG